MSDEKIREANKITFVKELIISSALLVAESIAYINLASLNLNPFCHCLLTAIQKMFLMNLHFLNQL